MDANEGSYRNRLIRRTFLEAAGAMIATAGSSFTGSSAQQVSRVRGPIVWLDMDQKELDDAYDQTVYAQNAQQILARYAANSEIVRARLGPPSRREYGSTQAEALDIYATNRSNAPVNIFIHGGAWQRGSAEAYAFPAELFVNAGAHYVVPDFGTVADTGGSLMPIAQQVRRAIAWIYRNARTFGGDPERLYVSGHSSGGHLAAVLLVTDWQREFDLPSNTLKGGLCCSGMFDLKPVRLSCRSAYVTLTDEMEQALSPQRHLHGLNCPVIIAYGTCETPEFQRQSRDFAAALKKAGKTEQLLVGEGYNHFEILETLANPYGLLGRAVLEQMHLGHM